MFKNIVIPALKSRTESKQFRNSVANTLFNGIGTGIVSVGRKPGWIISGR